jgi:hypothetical protein
MKNFIFTIILACGMAYIAICAGEQGTSTIKETKLATIKRVMYAD